MTTNKRALRAALVLSFAVAPLAVGCSNSGSSALPDRTSSPLRSQTLSAPATSTRSAFSRPPTQAPPAATNAPPAAAAPITSTPAPAPPVQATQTAATTADESTPWGWILLAVAVAAAIVVTALLLHRRSRGQRLQAWRQRTRGAVDAAIVSRDLLPVHGRDIVDLTHWESVRAAADQAATGLQAAAGAAPVPEAAAVASTAADALTAMPFALESARLVQGAQPPPSAAQLADADAVVQSRKTELDDALDRLQLAVEPPAEAGNTRPAV